MQFTGRSLRSLCVAIILRLALFHFGSADSECTATLVGYSLSWSLSTSFSQNRQAFVFLRTAFDVTSCPSSCNFAVGSSPSPSCGADFGSVCFHHSSDPCTGYSTSIDTCENQISNKGMIIQGYHGDVGTDPTIAAPSVTASIGSRVYIYGELNATYNNPPNANYLITWYSSATVTSGDATGNGTLRTSISLTLPITNFYSPAPIFPLFVPVPYYGFGVQLKAYEFDGQPMVVDLDANVGISYSDQLARTSLVAGCCQCPQSTSFTTRNAFFDLATDPHAFSGPASTTVYDGPIVTNNSLLTNTTIDQLPKIAKGDIQRFRTLDAIFDRLWLDPSSAFQSSQMNQRGSYSTTVETYFQTSKNPATCTPSNTPRFSAPKVTEYSCPYYQIGTGGCKEIELVANGSSAKQPIRITPAVGFPFTDYNWLSAEALVLGSPLAGVATSGACQACANSDYTRQRCPCFCPESQFSQKRCWYRIPRKTVADVGTFVVQCFMAVSRMSSSSNAKSDSCYSAPICVKIYIAGGKPTFVDPTPLASNSENDNGVLIPSRTDVPACFGFPINLQVNVTDVDSNDPLRIFVKDTESIFFNSNLQSFTDKTDCSQSNGIIQPYLAQRGGDNSQQISDFALDSPNSIAAKFLATVNFSIGHAQQNIIYTLRPGNGYLGLPRPKLNRNVIVCGRAYDMSRLRYGRWVGTRFNLTMLDYSFGDYRSNEQCWRINLQAPPAIQQVSVRTSQQHYFMNKDGSFTVPAGTGIGLEILLSASDPNAQDRTQILLVGSTGLPVGASVVSTNCNASTICGAQDLAQAASDGLSAVLSSSSCSSVDFNLSWFVSPEDIGKSVRICTVPRDSSTLCIGAGPTDAVAQGWYGDTTCLTFNVAPPDFHWIIFNEFKLYNIFVGCNFSFQVGLNQSTKGYGAQILLVDAPTGATVTQECTDCTGANGLIVKGTVSWNPPRGFEGREYNFCIAGSDGAMSKTDPKCFKTYVEKCRYCVSASDVLTTVRVSFGVDTNWLRLWSLNSDTAAGLGLESACVDTLNCDPHKGSALIDNPELSLAASPNKTIIWVGTVFKSSAPESLVSLAGRFHTTIKSLLSVNPDQESSTLPPGSEMCIVACNSQA